MELQVFHPGWQHGDASTYHSFEHVGIELDATDSIGGLLHAVQTDLLPAAVENVPFDLNLAKMAREDNIELFFKQVR